MRFFSPNGSITMNDKGGLFLSMKKPEDRIYYIEMTIEVGLYAPEHRSSQGDDGSTVFQNKSPKNF